MRKATLLFLLAIFLSGCATYKFHHGKVPYNKGYVVSRDDYAIIEYTLGKDNTVPNLKLAKERFKRRRDTVEDYYKRMGYIENHFKMVMWDPIIMVAKIVGGVFRLPFIAISDYKAAHNPQYKEKLRKIEDERDAREEARINALKEKLNAYIQKDLAREPAFASKAVSELPKAVVQAPKEESAPLPRPQAAPEPEPTPQPAPLSSQAESVTSVKEEPEAVEPKEEAAVSAEAETKPPEEERAEIKEIPPPVISATSGLTAVIVAKPVKGLSPLRVSFSGSKSHAVKGRIVSYLWDFGYGDTSTKISPINTYYSCSFEPQYFKVILTVQDNQGNTAQASATIEVLNK